MRKHLIWVVFLIALFLRLYQLTNFPAGFTADEAAQGYTAYSILKTGRDEWGVRLPLTPRFFGDFKPPLLTYLLVPSIAVFGLNEFSVRLPNAILGSLAVVVVYFLVRKLFGDSVYLRGMHSPTSEASLLASFFLAISSWHISLSRAAFEMNLVTFFLPLAVWLFLLGLSSSWFMVLSSFVFGLNLFTYHSAKVVTPLILLFLLLWKRKRLQAGLENRGKSCLVISGVIIFGFGILMLRGFTQGAGTRASDIGIFSGKFEEVANDKHFAASAGLPINISRFFYNKAVYAADEFFKSYLSYISPYFLFSQGAGEATYGMMPGEGLLYLIEFLFLFAALYFTIRNKDKNLIFLWFWVLVSPIPASLTRGVGYHASRLASMMPAIQILSAYGFLLLLYCLPRRLCRDKGQIRRLTEKTGYIVILLSFLFFAQKYFFLSSSQLSPKMNFGWREATGLISSSKAKKVIVSRSLGEPQAFIMFYLKLDPDLVQKQTVSWLRYEEEGKKFVDQIGTYSLDKFTFRNFSFPEDWEEEDVLLVGSESDFIVQEKNISILKSPRIIKDEKGKEIILEPVIKKEENIFYPSEKVAFKLFTL